MKSFFTNTYRKIRAYLKSVHWFGLILGIISGFILMAAVTNIVLLKNIIGSIVGSMISAGAALYILYHQEGRQNEKDEKRINEEMLEKKQKRIKVTKRIGFLKVQISEEAVDPAKYYYTFSKQTFHKFENLYRHNLDTIESYIYELNGYNIDLIDVDKLDDYLETLQYLKKWDREIRGYFVMEDLDAIGNEFIQIRDKFLK